MKRVNEIQLYSSFKRASDYRQLEITQDLHFKENQFKGRIICFWVKIISYYEIRMA